MSLITISLIENKLSIEKGLTGGMGMKTGGAPRRVVKFVSGRSLWVLNQGSQINKIMRGLRMDVLQGTIYCVQLSPLWGYYEKNWALGQDLLEAWAWKHTGQSKMLQQNSVCRPCGHQRQALLVLGPTSFWRHTPAASINWIASVKSRMTVTGVARCLSTKMHVSCLFMANR